jgi:hypothetical protein
VPVLAIELCDQREDSFVGRHGCYGERYYAMSLSYFGGILGREVIDGGIRFWFWQAWRYRLSQTSRPQMDTEGTDDTDDMDTQINTDNSRKLRDMARGS